MSKKEVKKNKGGRPTVFTKEIFDEFCQRISIGESTVSICKDPKMPSRESFNHWMAKDKELFDKYMRAKELCGDYEFDEIKQITDEAPLFFVDEKGNKKVDTGWVQLQRLRADKRQWRASKLHARRYGDATTLRGDADAPLVPVFNLTLTK